MITIELDDTLISMGHRIADNRHDSFASEEIQKEDMDSTSYERHLLGALTELAVSDYYDLVVDMKIRIHGDDHDFKAMYQGEEITLGVKSTSYKPPWLQVDKSGAKNDYYILTFISDEDPDCVELRGWASREMLQSGDLMESPCPGLHHLNYRLWEDELDPLPAPDKIEDRSPVVMA